MDKVLIAGITGPRQYFDSIHSWENMTRRKGDMLFHQPVNIGEMGRQLAVEKFLSSPEFDAIFMCDLDQQFPMDTLEKLRNHDLDMVSGHYMQRRTSTLRSNWKYTLDGGWPYLPYLYRDIPTEGMHRIASTGMGCVLIKREVVVAVKKYLDYWEPNSNPFEIGKIPELDIRFGNFGSDYRFFFYAQKLGFALWGDASIETPHAANIWMTRDVHEKFLTNPAKDAELLNKDVFLATIRSKGMLTINALEARRKALEGVLSQVPFPKELDRNQLAGQLYEVDMWIAALSEESPPPGFVEKWYRDPQPALEDAGVKFPTFKTREELDAKLAAPESDIEGNGIEEAKKARKTASRNGAKGVADMLNGQSDGEPR